MRPKTAKTPATMPIAAPLTSFVIFWVSSALASAISSRTRSWARSVTSWTAWPSWEVSGSGTKGPQDLREGECGGEGDPDLDLGPVAEGQVGKGVVGGRAGCGGCAGGLRPLGRGGGRPRLRAEAD